MPGSPEQLFAQFRATGDPGPLGELFDRASPQLLALALHLCGNPADAEDALQATFVTAIGRRADWDSARPVLPWLCGILTLQTKKIGERRVRRREAELPELVLEDGSPVDASERRELVGKLRHHVDQLPQEQRQVLLLQLEHGLSPAEVAEVLGVAPGTVRMRLHRGLKALRGLMPAGLLTALLAALPSRGLAAVRAAVVQHAVAGIAVVGGGALLMKKVLVGVAVLALLAIGWNVAVPFWRTAEAMVPESAAPIASHVERPQTPAAGANAPNAEERVAVLTAVPPPEATAPRGTLLVRTLKRDTRAPVPHVPVRIVAERGDVDSRFELTTAVTGEDGTCTIADVAPGAQHVLAGGNLQCVVQVAAGVITTAELEFPTAHPVESVRGQVVHAAGGPAAGATIVIGAMMERHAEAIATADAAGRFEASMPRGLHMLGARLPGFAASPMEFVSPRRELELVLPGPGAAISGVVVDSDGTPLANAVVEVGEPRLRRRWYTPDRMFESAPAQRLRTDGAGRFHAVDLPADELSVFVRADGHAAFHRFVTTVAAETLTVRCELLCGAAVHGRVVDESGEPVAGVHAYLGGGAHGEPRMTDAEGRFGYRHVAIGPQQLEVSGDGITTKSCERAETEVGEWLIVVHRLPRYLLRFTDESGCPLVGWTVGWQRTGNGEAKTDAMGRVALHANAEGEHALRLAPASNMQAAVPCAWPAGLVPGIETTIVVPTDAEPRAVVTGIVLGPDGTPLASGWIKVTGTEDVRLNEKRIAAGPFRIERVPPGDCVLEVLREGWGTGVRFPVKSLQNGEVRDVGELRLPPEGSLQVRVVFAPGSASRDASVFLFDSDGREHFAPPRDAAPQPWPAGRFTWKAMADDSLWQAGVVDVRAGETTSLDITLQPGVRRYLQFPVPRPDWGNPTRVDYVLRATDGSEYDKGDFDPRAEMPFRYMPALSVGDWRLELVLDDGRRFAGTFALPSLVPSLESIRVAVQPAR